MKLLPVKTFLLFLLIFTNPFIFAQQVQKPFPQHIKYFNGTILPNHVSQHQLDDSTRRFYTLWKERYINDDAAPNQNYVWVEGSVGKKICVSEGQGYGMIIVALMAGYDTAAQITFNKLYNYFKAHPSSKSNYLMAWAQNKTFKDIDGSTATDGDMDIAYSLLLANKQWGSKGLINYLEEAKKMITAIYEQEINPITFSILLSNQVQKDSKDYYDTRTSDFMPAHLRSFSKYLVDSNWLKVIDENYTLFNFMQNKYSHGIGLVPDFIQHINTHPVPAKSNYLESRYDGLYNYNACRVPWRIATDYIINGDSRSKKMIDRINVWIRETTRNIPDNISAGYTLSGEDIRGRNFEAMSFIGSFAVAAMVDKRNQKWLNNMWDYIFSFDLDQYDYYDNSIKMFELIILSGNYWVP